jgi:hypothetical protein
MGKINWFLSSQNFHNIEMEIPFNSVDNLKVVGNGAGLNHPKATLACIGYSVRLHG